ncbi:MAG: phage holin family protein [Cryomorphaceae bacterium]|nr:phage holin family protein [Cryomorphaceae bacterium]
MKPAILILPFCLLLVCCVIPHSNAQDSAENAYIMQQYEFLKEQQKEVKAEYEKITKELKEERKAHQDFVEGMYKWIAIFVSVVVFLAGGILAFFGWNRIDQVKKDVDTIVTQKCTEMIADVVSGRRDVLSEQLKKYDRQAYLRKNKTILLLDTSGEGIEVEKYLSKLGFHVGHYQIGDYFNENGTVKQKLKGWEAVVFYKTTKEFPATQVISQLTDKALVFYQPDGRITSQQFNITAIQMPGQLYGNLMNLLEYMEIRK